MMVKEFVHFLGTYLLLIEVCLVRVDEIIEE